LILIVSLEFSCGGSSGTATGGGATVSQTYRYYLYVVNYGSNSISSFSMNPNTGNLVSIETIGAGTGGNPMYIATNPSKSKIFVTKAGISNAQSNVQIYSIVSTTGALTPFQNFKAGAAGGNDDATSISISPNGAYAYISADNASTPIADVYSISSLTGSLSSSSTASLARPGRALMHSSGNFLLWSSSMSGALFSHSVNSSSGIVNNAPITAASLTNAESIALTPDGQRIYVGTLGNNIQSYTIHPTTGIVSPIETKNVGATTRALAVSPNGQILVAVSSDSSTLYSYRIDQTTGLLTQLDSKAVGTYPRSISFDPDGNFIFVANQNSNNISVLSLDSNTGSLTNLSTVSVGNQPYYLVTLKIAD